MRKHSVLLLTVAFVACIVAEQAGAQNWWNRAWNYRKKITIEAGSVASNLTDFPVLVSITDSDVAGRAKEDGSDVVVATDSGTKCPREIEYYTNTTGTLVLWFKAPTLVTNANNIFYLYYGNPSGSDSDSTDVWDSNYVFVHHMEEDPSALGNCAVDSTAFGNDGSDVGSMTANDLVGGQIGQAWDFDGVNDYVQINSSPGGSLDIATFTMSAWVYCRNTQIEDLFSRQSGAYGSWMSGGWRCEGYDADSLRVRIRDSAGNEAYDYLNTAVSQNIWVYRTLRIRENASNSTITYFENGVLKSTQGNPEIAATSTNVPVRIGKTPNYSDEHNGLFDEVRMSDILRPAGWIKTSYSNQVAPTAFCQLGLEEELPAAGTVVIVR